MLYTRCLTFAAFLFCACSSNNGELQEQEKATVASETGQAMPLPADVLYSTKSLINGKLYSKPDFKASPLAYFDTSQSIQVLDTTHTLFAKARIRRDTVQYVGYVPKTILPEQKK
ncbi:hypothetical protein [Pontibacter mangrovi]|uniref:SH3 domain-containing protein n=1 Tax=Pontibacter mangrovi TaxID=2589816 RepID=A0A501W5Z2_9BACT|nr:hypothetical protein [Pontibacter mangrovi]TPE45313.1 hypothetical protein FJM65_04545 [Pontibacter mangrovi]